MTEDVTEIPRCCSSRIQSEVAWRAALRPFTVPASWMAPPKSRSFSVSVVLPASGWEMMAKVRLFLISSVLTPSVIVTLIERTHEMILRCEAAFASKNPASHCRTLLWVVGLGPLSAPIGEQAAHAAANGAKTRARRKVLDDF